MYREHREVLKLIECQLLKKTIESNLDSIKEFSRNMLAESQKSNVEPNFLMSQFTINFVFTKHKWQKEK